VKTRAAANAAAAQGLTMTHQEILGWLLEDDASRLEELWRQADAMRCANVGDEVHLRGLVEISNCCVRSCGYCGLRAANTSIARYRMSADEIIQCAHDASAMGYGTVVLQAGEDYGITCQFIVDVIGRIRSETALAVTLSLGERPDEDLVAWRNAGADRYLLRFETGNAALYSRIHPPLPGRWADRFAILRRLGELGYEVGSGVMIGIPGQSYRDLADDIATFARLNLDMIGVGPFIPHPQTPLGSPGQRQPQMSPAGPDSQAPNTELMTYKAIALTRLVCPKANIPSTTALATLNKAQGRELGLMRGANIVMPNVTPPKYRAMYEIYPAKACIDETARECHACMRQRIASIGRTPGSGRGDSPNAAARRGA
jgi:biotin synthase